MRWTGYTASPVVSFMGVDMMAMKEEEGGEPILTRYAQCRRHIDYGFYCDSGASGYDAIHIQLFLHPNATLSIPLDVLLHLADAFLPFHDRARLSRTCTRMAPLRPALFKKITLTQADYVEPVPGDMHLLTVVRQKRHLCDYVKDLEVLEEAYAPAPCIEIIASMSFLRKLHIAIPWFSFCGDSLRLERALVRLVTLPTLRSLTFSRCCLPIVKIANALASEVHPIVDLRFNRCGFTTLESQLHTLTSVPLPSDDPKELSAWAAASQRLAPTHTGRRWGPTHLDVHASASFWRDMAPFVDASRLRILTIDWPPQASFDFGAWGIASLDQLRLHGTCLRPQRRQRLIPMLVIGKLVPLDAYHPPSCAHVFVIHDLFPRRYNILSDNPAQLSAHDILQDLPIFLARATDIEDICIKIVADPHVLQTLLTTAKSCLRHAICSAHPATTSLLFGLSIAHPRKPLSMAWISIHTYSAWFEQTHALVQTLLPTQDERPGHAFRAGLFLERDRVLSWNFTPSLEEDFRSVPPAWFSVACE